MPSLRIVVVGNRDRAEFRPLICWLEQQGYVLPFGNLEDAIPFLADGSISVLILLKSIPFEFAQAVVSRLRCAAPLLPVIVVNGNWCEADSRTGDPMRSAWRLNWQGWRGPLVREFAALRAGLRALSAMPASAAAEERIRAGSVDPFPPWDAVAVVAQDWHTADAIRRACAAVSVGAVWVRPAVVRGLRQLRCLLFDVPSRPEHVMTELEQVQRTAKVPPIAIIGFPRPAEIEQLARRRIGVLSKPYSLVDLRTRLDEAMALPADRIADAWSEVTVVNGGPRDIGPRPER